MGHHFSAKTPWKSIGENGAKCSNVGPTGCILVACILLGAVRYVCVRMDVDMIIVVVVVFFLLFLCF